MIETDAIEYIDKISESAGATKPIIIAVKVSSEGDIFQVFIKLTDTISFGKNSYIAESISSLLAHDLQINTPLPCIVHLSQDFIDSVSDKEIRDRMNASERIVFGTKRLDHYSEVIRGMPLNKVMLQQALEIFAFDTLMENPDRGGTGKTNCMFYGNTLSVIDHEKAFAFAMAQILFGRIPPWQLGGLEPYRARDSHLFVNNLLDNSVKIELGDFQSKWESLTDERLQEYGRSIPPEWLTSGDCLKKILSHIQEVRNNMPDCIKELYRVLGKVS